MRQKSKVLWQQTVWIKKRREEDLDRFRQYTTVAAAKEAFEDAGLDMEKEDPYRVGCALLVPVSEAYSPSNVNTKNFWQKDHPESILLLVFLLMITNMATGNCNHSAWFKRKKYQRGNCLRDRYAFHW